MKKELQSCHKNTNQKKDQLFKEHIILIEERIELSKKSNQELLIYKKIVQKKKSYNRKKKRKKERK